MQKLRIFAASPSDMATERTQVERVATVLKPMADKLSVVLHVVDWRAVVPDMGRPEQVIIEQLKPTEWDVFIGLLWHRFGTPPGGTDPQMHTDYHSGTEEEFKTAYRLWRQFRKPRILMYRCTRPVPLDALDPDQYKRVKDFFAQFEAVKGEHPGLYQSFETTDAFEQLLLDNLQKLLFDYDEQIKGGSGHRGPLHLRDHGGSNACKEMAAFAEIQERLQSIKSWQFDALTLSAHNLDLIHEVDRVEPDYETKITHPAEFPGGSGANTIYGLAKLGQMVAATGLVARDKAGRLLKENLSHIKVNLDCLAEVSPREGVGTGQTLIFADREGRRSIYWNPGVNEEWASVLQEKKQKEKLLQQMRSSRIIHLSSFTGRAERELQESLIGDIPREAIVSFTPGALYAKLGLDRLSEILKRTNVLFLYENQLDELLEGSGASPGNPKVQEKLWALFQWKCRNGFGEPLIVVVKSNSAQLPTAPARGVTAPEYLQIACGRWEIDNVIRPEARASNPVSAKPKDATGAGDAIAAGVLFGLLNGKDLNHGADLAFVMAISASQEVGARSGLPNRNQLCQRWSTWFPNSGRVVP
jgi:ribokinase